MRSLLLIAILIVAGALTWQIGARLSTDAVGMAVGMLFGALSGIPAALLILGTAAQQPRRGGYDEGFDAGMREAHRQMLDVDARRLVARQSAELQRTQPPPVIVVNPPAQHYTPAHPFGPVDVPDWCGPWELDQPRGVWKRQFRITGLVE